MDSTVALLMPTPATHSSLLVAMHDSGVLAGDWKRLVVTIPDNCFVTASGLAFLAAWGIVQRAKGRTLEFYGDIEIRNYLSRMDLFRILGFHFEEEFNRHAEAGRFLPVKTVSDQQTVFEATNAICDLVLRLFDNAREFLPALEWCVNEIIDNVRLHAEAPAPGAVCAQFYPQRHRLDVAIVDQGRGIKTSLSERLVLKSHREAIERALERGMTRNPDIGQGNGLTGSREIVRLNGGEMHIWTGDSDYSIREGQDVGFRAIPLVSGTGVLIRLDTSHPVRLSDTFIGDSDWSYLNFESERIRGAGGLQVRNECVHTGGREPAITLRRKIEALLPTMEGPIVLDFTGVRSATSSFFDELLGRLAKSLGKEQFSGRIHVANLDRTLNDVANVVIHQRLGS